MILLVAFVFGISVGSFLNVLVDRLPRNETFWTGRSHCDKCKKKLEWHDLIPLFSYLYLNGKCRYCKAKIPYRIFLVELLTGLVFSLSTIYYRTSNINYFSIELLFFLIISAVFIVIFFTDLEYGIIPDQMLIALFFISLGFAIFLNSATLPIRFLSAFGAFLFFFLLFIITKTKGMGFGDVKFAFVLGFLLGFPKTVISLYLAFLTGAFISIILILWKKKKLKGTTVPFGPFLIIGSVIALLWGENILLFVRQYFSI